MKKKLSIDITFIILLFCCCDITQFSPYDSDIKSSHPNSIEIDKIVKTVSSESDTFKFAFLSDPHDNFDDLNRAVSSLNKQQDIMFVVCGGDVTNNGLVQHYNWYVDIIKKSKYPFLTVIGNHDYRSNGKLIFEKIFGSTDYSFVLCKYKLIFFDNITQENSIQCPRYEWLKNEMADNIYKKIVFAHIPPWSTLMSGYHNILYCDIIRTEKTVLCLYGHSHNYTIECYDGVTGIVADDIEGRNYYVVSLVGDTALIKTVAF